MLAKESSGLGKFDLPEEVEAVLPSDPFEQLDIARKITSIALATRVSKLESESSRLRSTLHERDDLIADLQSQIESLHASLAQSTDRLAQADSLKERLLLENASLSNTVKKLNRDVSKQEEEIELVVEIGWKIGVRPVIGMRAKLRTKHAGHFGSTSGEKGRYCTSRRGLRRKECLVAFELRISTLAPKFPPPHCWPTGSPRPPKFIANWSVSARNEGDCRRGGLGVDYDGSRSPNSDNSVGYDVRTMAPPSVSKQIPADVKFSSDSHHGEEDAALPPSKSTSSVQSQFSETVNSSAEDGASVETDVSQAASIYGASQTPLLASYASTPKLTPPGSPPSLSASVSPTTSKPTSPRRHSLSFSTTRGTFDDRSSIFSSMPSSHHSSLSSSSDLGSQSVGTDLLHSSTKLLEQAAPSAQLSASPEEFGPVGVTFEEAQGQDSQN
ncbi:hypothetical protein Scep_030536 [Stephania cephalantha]|uniref:Uncharacterized protein n=1 Tax=Stephania cephalantha TaxID=152367 RepID=A0AAP0E2M9_9MAGN